MKKIKYILFALLSLSLASCFKPVEFDPGEISPYPVLVSRPECDSTVKVYLSYSHFFLDDGHAYKLITDAAVTLDINGVSTQGVYVVDNDEAPLSHYFFNVRPAPGDTLNVTARIPGCETPVTAGTRIPQLADYEILDYIIDTTDIECCYFKIRFKVKSHSPIDYYSVKFFVSDSYDSHDTTGTLWSTDEAYFRQVFFSVNDPIVNSSDVSSVIDGDDGSFYDNEMVFTSELFSGGEHEFIAIFGKWMNSDERQRNISQLPVYMHIRALSQDLYRYNLTRELNSDSDGIFSEPVQIYCNVNGGIGIFGASSLRKIHLTTPRFEHFNHGNTYYYYKK